FEAAVCAMAQPKPVGSAANGTTTNGHHTHNNGTAPHHDNHIGPQVVELDVVLHGPDECSQQSAKIVSQHFGGRVKLVDDFREMDLGLWEGLRECELLDRQPTAYKQWRADPSSVQPPDGDTVAE